ncbi:MAG: hypothetical protein AB1412_01925 [Pseudomonadota bacterium]
MTNIPHMSRAQINARAQAKEALVLDFLASGEVWSTAPLLAQLLALSLRRAYALIQRMERDNLLSVDRISSRLALVGITPTGLAYSQHPAAAQCPRFEPGRVSEAFIAHHIDTQRARLHAEAAGWGWTPGKLLYNAGLLKVPDALATSPNGERVAIEIERTIKTPLRYQQIIPAALRDIKAGRYDRVQYLSPQGRADAVLRALHRVQSVKVGGESVKLTDAHWARFRFANLADWPTAGAAE